MVTPTVQDMNATSAKARVLSDVHDITSTADKEESGCIFDYQFNFIFKQNYCIHCWLVKACRSALETTAESQMHALIKLKSKGWLPFPSKDVMDICVFM